MLGFGLPSATKLPGLSVRRGGGAYSPEAVALFARMTTEPDAPRKQVIDALILALLDAGVWQKLDGLYLMAAHDAHAARRNWIADAYNLSAFSSPVFTMDRGYAGDGAGAYMATGAPHNGLANFKKDSACFGVWARTTVHGYPVGAISNTAVSSRFDAVLFKLNDSQNTPHELTSAGNRLLTFDRPSSSTVRTYANGVFVKTATVASEPLTSADHALFRVATVYSNTQLSAFFYGASLTDPQHTALFNAVRQYLLAVGATT